MQVSRAVKQCPANQGYVRNQWYTVAFPHEVTRNKLFSRRCLDEKLVLYRTEDGKAAALTDRCGHRQAPFSMGGKIVGNSVQCPYHGIEYGPDGKCTKIPTQEIIPKQAFVRSYPTVETKEFIWCWMGDPAKADKSLLPDLSKFATHEPGWEGSALFTLECKSNYALLFDNLMDTSHVSFLHGQKVDSGRLALTEFEMSVDGNKIHIVRDLKSEIATPEVATAFKIEQGTKYARLQENTAYLPHFVTNFNTISFPDDPKRPPHKRANYVGVLPAGPGLHYQLHYMAISFPSFKGTHFGQANTDRRLAIFNEDNQVLEEIQKSYDELGPEIPEFSIKADQAALRARSLLAAMIEKDAPSGT